MSSSKWAHSSENSSKFSFKSSLFTLHELSESGLKFRAFPSYTGSSELYLGNVTGQWVVVGIKSLLKMERYMCSLCLFHHFFQKDFHPSWTATRHFNIFRCSGQNGILNIISFSPVLSLCSPFLHYLVPYKTVTEEWEVCADGTVI